jgi:crotonobetainyl-CoA:carnitine CoA-transferase CaiB-like acyl-CoA transferase
LLDDVRVLDFTQALAGPYATMVLGDLGADVIKVEPPGKGDDTRQWGPPFLEDQSAYFLSINRNKRSITLDLKSPAGLQAARDLASACDVVVENFRPGTATRLGVGPEELRSDKPSLIYCSISGFGQGAASRPGYDQVVQGTAGLMSITGAADGLPTKLGVPISDIVAGMFASHSILAALYRREKTGAGAVLDIAMQDSVIALLTYQAGRYFATGVSPRREGNHHPTIAPYGTFPTADGYVNISVGNDAQWQRFCTALSAEDMAARPEFASNRDRLGSRHELHRAIEELLSNLTTDQVLARLEKNSVPSGPIRTLEEVFTDPEVIEREMKVDLDHPTVGEISVTGLPWMIDGAKPKVRHAPPLLGQHTDEVLREVTGYDQSAIDAVTG